MIQKCIVCLSASLFLLGCTGAKDVKPWEKGNLAKETMQFSGPYPEVTKMEQHIYASKEASKGGYGVAGGGCGCN